MIKQLLLLLPGIFTLSLAAQTPEPFEFKEYKHLAATPVKNQEQTGTCWSFSTTSFLESEAMRMGKGEHDLSEMFTVRYIYRQKCENYVRRMGKAQFSEGGLAHDELNVVQQYGVVPESVYPGRKDPSKPLNHSLLERQLKKMCDSFIALGEKGELRENWLAEIDRALDAEFGEVPVKFTYNNTVFTPISFRDYLGLNAGDYVHITSFSHHPFWSSFILEVPDNFANGAFFNVPLGDLMRCLNNAIQQGYTVEWDADVSNPGFSANRGIALAPEADWKSKSAEQIANTFKYWEQEKPINQAYRQREFDRLETQDDHLMHIIGMLNETHGDIFYIVKNSWGEISEHNGLVYVSESYMRLNTISFSIHKDALPEDIRKRLEPGGAMHIEKNTPETPLPRNNPSHDSLPLDKQNLPQKTQAQPQRFQVAPAKRIPASKE